MFIEELLCTSAVLGSRDTAIRSISSFGKCERGHALMKLILCWRETTMNREISDFSEMSYMKKAKQVNGTKNN